MSLLEVPVSSLIQQLGLGRRRAVWLSVAVIAVIGLPAALQLTVLEQMDALFGGVLLIVGGLALAVLMAWRAPDRLRADLRGSGTAPALVLALQRGLRWVSVPVVSLGLAVSVLDLIRRWRG